jgi:hypothetical protein
LEASSSLTSDLVLSKQPPFNVISLFLLTIELVCVFSCFTPSLAATWFARSKCFHYLPSVGSKIFPSVLQFTCQSNNLASLGLENIHFKRSITGRYHITRAEDTLSKMTPLFTEEPSKVAHVGNNLDPK